MRALETGAWIVRTSTAGISGIIAPNGRYVSRTDIGQAIVLHGFIGPRAGSFFPAIGSPPIAFALLLLYASIVARAPKTQS
jgi:apolipoprotein N-acyltransferase